MIAQWVMIKIELKNDDLSIIEERFVSCCYPLSYYIHSFLTWRCMDGDKNRTNFNFFKSFF